MLSDTTVSTKPLEEYSTMIPTTTSPIGLLNSYEYYKSYQNTAIEDGYLNIGYYWYLLNPYSDNLNFSVSHVGVSGGDKFFGILGRGVRPVVYLKSGITLTGNGTKASPYVLSSDYSNAVKNDKINTRYSGEYIKFASDGNNDNYENAPLYRIVGVEGDGESKNTKIVSTEYIADNTSDTPIIEKKLASSYTYGASTNTQSNDYWDYYLNNDWYNGLTFKDKIESGIFYIGIVETNENYKLTVCKEEGNDTIKECLNNSNKRINSFFEGNIGLLRYGEMFAAQYGEGFDYYTTKGFWLMSKFINSAFHIVGPTGMSNSYGRNSVYAVRPTFYINNNIKIISGAGTELNPYIVD